ncbi:hypothetical protein C5167_038062 [Papaver somniferum]|uniref:Uncharacterized protein n=1 Tax=Papaver somniferum TaxID=3469 RepID=A0A4Y7I840_PAPSO|nr:hypothetical protein C5167_038062 [Papaver somniferum]
MSILFWKHNIITELRELTYMSLQLGLVKGETEQASSTFKIVLEGNPKNVPMRFLVRHVFSSALTVTQSLWTYIRWDTLESDLDSSCELMNSDTWIASGFGENHLGGSPYFSNSFA